MSFNCQQEIILENGRAKLLPLQMTHLDQLLSITAVETNLVQYSPSAVYNAADLRQYMKSGLSDRASSKGSMINKFPILKRRFLKVRAVLRRT